MTVINQEYIINFGISITNLEERLRSVESDLNLFHEEKKLYDSVHSSSNVSVESQCDSLNADKFESNTIQMQRLRQENRNLSVELQEWKIAYNEKTSECENNRDKYLRAQQLAEEYRRQLDMINKETSHNPDQINTCLQLANERIKEQLEELGHLPFVLEAKQLELQETVSKLKLAEKAINALSADLESCIVKCELLQKDLEQERMKSGKLQQEGESILKEIHDWKARHDELCLENKLLLKGVERMKFLEDCLEAKTKEVHQLGQHLDELKDESSRHITRIKDRADVQKKAYQAQISGLEEELVQLRANLSRAFKERDDIKQRMQMEISNLEQKFSDAQLEIRSLKSHVDILKSSYANIFDVAEEDSEDETDD